MPELRHDPRGVFRGWGRLAAVALALAWTCVPSRAEAAETLAFYPPDLARPPVDGLGFLFVDGTRLALPGTLSVASTGAWVKRLPSQVSPTTGGGPIELALRDGWSVSVSLGYVLARRLAVYPTLLIHTEGGLTSSTETTLDAKWQLIEPAPIGVALRTSAGCGFTWGPCDPQLASWFLAEALGSPKPGGVRLGFALGTALRGIGNYAEAPRDPPRPPASEFLDASRRSVLMMATALGVVIVNRVEAILEVRAFHLLTSRALGGEGSVGLRIDVTSGAVFRIGIGPRFGDQTIPTLQGPNVMRTADLRGFAGLELSLGTRSVPVPGKDVPSDLEPSDVDHDGIADAHDRCPWVSAPEYIDGCPHEDVR